MPGIIRAALLTQIYRRRRDVNVMAPEPRAKHYSNSRILGRHKSVKCRSQCYLLGLSRGTSQLLGFFIHPLIHILSRRKERLTIKCLLLLLDSLLRSKEAFTTRNIVKPQINLVMHIKDSWCLDRFRRAHHDVRTEERKV